MQIFIKTLTGKTITIDTDASTTIFELKMMIQDKEGVPPDEQRIIFAGKEVDNDTTIMDSNYQHDSIYHLLFRFPGGMQIFIRTACGGLKILDTESSESIQKIKEKICDRERVHVTQQTLIFEGKELENRRTLKDYHIQKENTISLVTSGRY